MRAPARWLLLLAVLAAGGCGGGAAPDHDAAVDGGDGGGDGGAAALCTATGGTVATQLCCGSVTDFPDLCGVGNCGCSPSASHEVQVCQCPAPQCFAPGKGCRTP